MYPLLTAARELKWAQARHPGPGFSLQAQSPGVHCCKATTGLLSHTFSSSPDRRRWLSLWQQAPSSSHPPPRRWTRLRPVWCGVTSPC